jgi:hypothetical protein
LSGTVDTTTVGSQNVTFTAVDNAGNSDTTDCSYSVVDPTAPVITPNVSGTLGDNGWYTSNVTVTFTVTDPESSIISSSPDCAATNQVTSDTNSVTFTCTATSAGGTSSDSVTIKRDATAPSLSPSVSPNPVVLNGAATASPNASDSTTPGSGLASSSCDPVDTSSVGSHSVNCTATDNAGNTANASASYNVIFGFTGFFRPIDNPNSVNSVKAGQAIPIKFSLGGDQGLDIFADGSPTSRAMVCSTGAYLGSAQLIAAPGASSLSYDATTDTYNFVWKSDKTWANSCRELSVTLDDGTVHTALFKFTK